MEWRRALLCAILLYVTLDLSLPTMPGAFVFEAGDSVESIQVSRDRAAADVAALLALVTGAFARPQPRINVDARVALLSHAARPLECPVVVSRLPRSALRVAPPSEDSH